MICLSRLAQQQGSLFWSSRDYQFILLNLCFLQTQVHYLKRFVVSFSQVEIEITTVLGATFGRLPNSVSLFKHEIWLICCFTWGERKLFCLAFTSFWEIVRFTCISYFKSWPLSFTSHFSLFCFFELAFFPNMFKIVSVPFCVNINFVSFALEKQKNSLTSVAKFPENANYF